MSGVFATLAAVLEDLDLVWGIKLVFLGDVIETATDGTFQTKELSGSFFSHIG